MGCCLSRLEKPPPDSDEAPRPSPRPTVRKSTAGIPKFSEWRRQNTELPDRPKTVVTETPKEVPKKLASLPSTDQTTPADTPTSKRSKSPFPVSPPLKPLAETAAEVLKTDPKPSESLTQRGTQPRIKSMVRSTSTERKSEPQESDRPALIVPSAFAKTGRPLGLDNLGNTCYMNSVLQCLCRAPGFLERLEARRSDVLVDRLARLFRSCHDQREVFSELRDFRRVLTTRLPKFKGGQQEDAKDFLLELMNYLEKANRPAAELFYGKRADKITCLACDNQIPAEAELFLVPVERQRALDVTSYLLRAQNDEFRLTGDNKLKCSKCKTSSDASVVTKIVRAPPILVVYIEPFDMHGRRIGQTISYSERVTLLSKRYDLFAAVTHRGNSIHSGHFTAQVKYKEWFQCDDAYVTQVSRATSTAAYFLFYEAVDS